MTIDTNFDREGRVMHDIRSEAMPSGKMFMPDDLTNSRNGDIMRACAGYSHYVALVMSLNFEVAEAV